MNEVVGKSVRRGITLERDHSTTPQVIGKQSRSYERVEALDPIGTKRIKEDCFVLKFDIF
jgi:hypothetical protein